MKYLKIVAENYNEAIRKLRTDHGDEAIPISHKYIRQGGLLKSRIFAREMVELTAAVKEKKPFVNAPVKKSTIDFIVDDKKDTTPLGKVQDIIDRAVATKDTFSVDSINRSIETLNDNLNTLRKPEQPLAITIQPEAESMAVKPADRPVYSKEPAARSNSQGGIEKEVSDIKQSINKLLEIHKKGGLFQDNSEENSYLAPYMNMLIENDFDHEDCELIIGSVKNAISRDDLRDRYKIEKTLKDLIKSRIVTAGPIKKSNKKKIIIFIGPTGVGKTTTMAKLGAIHSLREGKKVTFVTIDNYRIAATEQLKKYAEIMRIPVHVVSDQKHFKDLVLKEKADIIMVDTSGRSHNNELKISEIKSFTDNIDYDFEKILCVSANTKKCDLKNIFKAFDVMKFDSVIITKVDETSFIGNVIDVADKYSKPISYFTNGQEVPNDIHIADADRMADMIIRHSGD